MWSAWDAYAIIKTIIVTIIVSSSSIEIITIDRGWQIEIYAIRCYTNYVGRYPLARSCTTSYNNNAIHISIIIIIIIIIVVISYTSYYNNCIYIVVTYDMHCRTHLETKTRKKHNLYRARRYNES